MWFLTVVHIYDTFTHSVVPMHSILNIGVNHNDSSNSLVFGIFYIVGMSACLYSVFLHL